MKLMKVEDITDNASLNTYLKQQSKEVLRAEKKHTAYEIGGLKYNPSQNEKRIQRAEEMIEEATKRAMGDKGYFSKEVWLSRLESIPIVGGYFVSHGQSQQLFWAFYNDDRLEEVGAGMWRFKEGV